MSVRYPFTPTLLDAMPEGMAELYRDLESRLLLEICSRLKATGELNEVTIQDIRALRSHGIPLGEIETAMRKTTGIGERELQSILKDVLERNQRYYSDLIDLARVTAPPRLADIEDVYAVYEQTMTEYRNITQSLGFLTDGGRTFLPPAKAYQWALDKAELQVMSGTASYNQAIRGAVVELAEGGLKTVNWESGHIDQADVAVRRAVMTGVNQLCQKYADQSLDYLETDLVEVSAHGGARDVDGPKGWENHKAWQGKVYRWNRPDYPQTSTGNYPDFVQTCGYGDVQGIEGANCRHHYSPFIEGVMERTYTDEQLANIDPPPFTYEGRTYTAYQAAQKQRQIERTVRKLKRKRDSARAVGLDADADAAQSKIRRLSEKYREFSRVANLPEQRERMKVYEAKKAELPLVKEEKAEILPAKEERAKNAEMPPAKEEKAKNAEMPLANEQERDIIKVTQVRSGHKSNPPKAESNAIIDHLGDNGIVETRSFYNANGMKEKDITNHNHKQPKHHPYGEHGEHAHDYIWNDDGSLKERTTRELTEEEREGNRDML